MDSRDLVQLAKALTGHENVSVASVLVRVEKDGVLSDHVVHSNGDLYRPIHIGELGFDDAEAVLDYVTQA